VGWDEADKEMRNRFRVVVSVVYIAEKAKEARLRSGVDEGDFCSEGCTDRMKMDELCEKIMVGAEKYRNAYSNE
jgi:hypothetical protein